MATNLGLRSQKLCPVHSLLRAGRALIGFMTVLLGAARLAAQGVTGAAIQGIVVTVDNVPIEEATVVVTNTANGGRWHTATRSQGRFYVENLSVGGPYRIEARAVGFEAADRAGIFLSLGERLTMDFRLLPATFQLAEVSVQGTGDPVINPGRTGPAQTLSQSAIAGLPSGAGGFMELVGVSPQVTSGPDGAFSFTGQHGRLNSLQIDGATNNDLFGLSGSGIGTPGGFLAPSALAPEAVQEVQIVTAPFDVRYGNFSGGLVNAVSKSGTNRFEGSVFSYLYSNALTGRDSTGNRGTGNNRHELGLTLGGPIVPNRLAFFMNAGLQRQYNPQPVPAPEPDTTGGADSIGVGIRYVTLLRFQNILRSIYDQDPGTFGFSKDRAPSENLFLKLTANFGFNNRLELSHNYLHGTLSGDGARGVGFYELSSAGIEEPVPVSAIRLHWTTAFGRALSNELILGRLNENDHCIPKGRFPGVEVSADAGAVAAGVPLGCSGSTKGQTIWEMSDNFGWLVGPHHLTLGTHDELIHLLDAGLPFSGGRWFFSSLDSLELGVPAGYLRDIPGPLRPEGARADFRIHQFGLYAQDQWAPTSRLTLTLGLRFDVPFLPTSPAQNPVLLAQLGINTARSPSGHVLWSPRLGVNYDVSGRDRTFLRGGIGLFVGRPAYVWLREAYFRTGLEQFHLECFGDAAPIFTLDPARQPTECASAEQPTPIIAYFNPKFRYPRNFKTALGVDHRLPWGVVGTVDFVYTRGVSQFEERDANLLPPAALSLGEAGRALYGTIDPLTGVSSPNRRDSAFGPVIEIKNGSGDRAYSLTFQVQKPFARGIELSAAYTYTSAKDRSSNPGDLAFSNLGATPLDGTWESRNLRTSLWSTPHKITVWGTVNLPLAWQLGFIYTGGSGAPVSYIVRGDANADGLDNISGSRDNDLIYVPRTASDITLADSTEYSRLNQIIQEEACLRSQRGHLLQRNSCRDPWVHGTLARLTKVFPTSRGQSLQVSASLFNVLNFLDKDWGLERRTVEDLGFRTLGNRTSLLELVGYDRVKSRGIYRVLEPGRRRIDIELTRWQLQLSARYTF